MRNRRRARLPPVTIAVLRGLLSRFLDGVNYVNAPHWHATCIVVKEARASRSTDFVNSITVRVTVPRYAGGRGAVFGTTSAPGSY